jgi:hypothetical protein
MIRRNSRAIAIGNDADRNGWRQRSLLISNPERYYGGVTQCHQRHSPQQPIAPMGIGPPQWLDVAHFGSDVAMT